MKLNKSTAILSVKVNPASYLTIPSKWRYNYIVTYEAVTRDLALFAYAPKKLRQDRDFTAALCRANWQAIKYAEIVDLEIAATAVAVNGRAYKYIPHYLRCNVDLLISAINTYPPIIKYMPKCLSSNARVIGVAAMLRYDILPLSLRLNKRLAMAAAETQGFMEYIPKVLHNDIDVTEVAVRNGNRFRRFSELITDKNVALRYISHPHLYTHLCHRLKCDPDILNIIMQNYPDKLVYSPKKVQTNRDVAMCMALHGLDMEYLRAFQYDRELVMTAVSNRGVNISYLPDRLKRDYEIVLAAVTNNRNALYGLPGERRYDHDILMAAESKMLPIESIIESAKVIGAGVCDKLPKQLRTNKIYLDILRIISESPRDKVHLDAVVKYINLSFSAIITICSFKRWPSQLANICASIKVFEFKHMHQSIAEDIVKIILVIYKN